MAGGWRRVFRAIAASPAVRDSSAFLFIAIALLTMTVDSLATFPTSGVELFATYLFALKGIVLVLAVLMLISGLDDLMIDILYWLRRGRRRLTVYRDHPRMTAEALATRAERPLAIMVPAWQETGVIGLMAEAAASTLEYENYHIFVGTYPNDAETQADVDLVCARFPNVHKVVCARPGPTSKADCLNNVLDAILRFEKLIQLEFAGFILHDAEDVVCREELRLFNYLVERKDLIQLPVYPFKREWTHFTSLHYLDEFAELHGKDVPVREAVAGQVPSAGVGTCFSRRAVLALIEAGNGIAFDVQSLTEDYDIGIRLKARGLEEIFVRFPVTGSTSAARPVCVREYFPDTAKTAIRQKARWIVGIVYQGYRTHGWTRDWRLNWFLWRDRKGAITNFISFLASLILLQMLGLWLYEAFWPDAWQFLSIFEGDAWLAGLLLANLCLMGNRMVQRVIFVSGYYGLGQGLMSIPRLFWGNFINFMANGRALSQVIRQGDARRVAWDKTTHDFPSIGQENRARRLLGELLVERGGLEPERLAAALAGTGGGLRLGSRLVHRGLLDTSHLAEALADQGGVDAESVNAWRLPPATIAVLPAALALHYGVLPVRIEGPTLVVATESVLDPVSLAALARKLDRPIRQIVARKGEVTVGLRHWYARHRGDDPVRLLLDAIAAGRLSPRRAANLLRYYVSRQVPLAEILVSLGHLGPSTLKAVLLRFEQASQPLGQFLVDEKVITAAALAQGLAFQARVQPDMARLIASESARQPSQARPASAPGATTAAGPARGSSRGSARGSIRPQAEVST